TPSPALKQNDPQHGPSAAGLAADDATVPQSCHRRRVGHWRSVRGLGERRRPVTSGPPPAGRKGNPASPCAFDANQPPTCPAAEAKPKSLDRQLTSRLALT